MRKGLMQKERQKRGEHEMRRTSLHAMTLALVLGFAAATSHAAFIDIGGGMVYDTDLNITWLQDANYAQTSGFDADGKMTWNEARF